MSQPWIGPVVLFDGTCKLCDGAVGFLIARDRAKRLRFATLQSDVGMRLAAAAGVDAGEDTLILIEDGRAHVRSTAVLRALAHVEGPWRFAACLRVVPRGVRDAVYRVVARYRERWFGRHATCRVPADAERERFLG